MVLVVFHPALRSAPVRQSGHHSVFARRVCQQNSARLGWRILADIEVASPAPVSRQACEKNPALTRAPSNLQHAVARGHHEAEG